MLYIKYKDEQTRSIYIQDFPIKLKDINEVEHIQADGHELDHIEGAFKNIPIRISSAEYPGGIVVTYYGDIARTILANL